MGIEQEQDRQKVQDLIRQIVVFMGNLTECEKTLSRLRNEATEIYDQLDDKLDEGEK